MTATPKGGKAKGAGGRRHRTAFKHAEPMVKVTMQLPQELADAVAALAHEETRSRQAQIAVLLREALDARARRRKPAP